MDGYRRPFLGAPPYPGTGPTPHQRHPSTGHLPPGTTASQATQATPPPATPLIAAERRPPRLGATGSGSASDPKRFPYDPEPVLEPVLQEEAVLETDSQVYSFKRCRPGSADPPREGPRKRSRCDLLLADGGGASAAAASARGADDGPDPADPVDGKEGPEVIKVAKTGGLIPFNANDAEDDDGDDDDDKAEDDMEAGSQSAQADSQSSQGPGTN